MGTSAADTRLTLTPLNGIPLVKEGDDLARVIKDALDRSSLVLVPGDVLAVAQKIVSKAEGQTVRLSDVTPGAQAQSLAATTEKDPRVVQLILDESRGVVRSRPGVIIVEHRLGIVLANAGIDRSNIDDDEQALLLPVNPDASAARLASGLAALSGTKPGIIVTDSVGRPFRLGTVGLAIGCSGVRALNDLRGRSDLFGRELQVAETAPADALAGIAALLMGEAAEATPAVLIRGLPAAATNQTATTVLRPEAEDLFR